MPDARGLTEPRLWTRPLRELTPKTSVGFEAVTFAEQILGIDLLPWQRWLLIHMLETTPEGLFRFRTAVVLVARQNGKSTVAQVLALWRMYVDRAPLVIGTAQSLDTAEEIWQGAVDMAESVPELAGEIADVMMAAGKKTLKLSTGERYKVASSNRRGGRGLSGDLVLLDELRESQDWSSWGALTKTTLARSRAQIIGLSNAGDDTSVVLNHLRAVALRDMDRPETDIAIFEWSAPDGCDLDDQDAWRQANPALGFTIGSKAIASALTTDPAHVFRTEVLCQRVDMSAQSPLPRWPDCLDAESSPQREWPVAFAVDVSWDRSTSWIVAAAVRPDGRVHVEVVASGVGTDWVLPWISERLEVWGPVAVAVQAHGAPASTLADPLEVLVGSARMLRLGREDLGRSCGLMFDQVSSLSVAHTGQEQLADAARSAAIRPLGDAWVFDRKKSPLDIAPLMAATEAVWAVRTFQPVEPEPERRRTGAVFAF